MNTTDSPDPHRHHADAPSIRDLAASAAAAVSDDDASMVDPALCPIGLVGAGAIASTAHLPAYRQAGFDVRAVYDVDIAAARLSAARFGIGKVCGSLDELLGLPEVAVVDVAVPAVHNPGIALRAFKAGKHVLLQKPMAPSADEAQAVVDAARQSGRLVAVNHQMRWAPSVRSAIRLIRQGALGQPLDYCIRFNGRSDWTAWPWLKSVAYPELWYHSIHYLDTARAWFGTPTSVYARLRAHPASFLDGPTRAVIVAAHASGVTGSVLVGHDSPKPPSRWISDFSIEGTDMLVEGRVGDLIGDLGETPDTIGVFDRSSAEPVELELEGSWFPDAFSGPMRSLLRAIAEGTEPETSGADAVETLRFVEAVEASHRLGRTIDVATTQTV